MNNEYIDLTRERRLNKKINELVSEENTSNNLWPYIKSKIDDVKEQSTDLIDESKPSKVLGSKWLSWGVAASLAVSISAFVFSFNNLKQTEKLIADSYAEQASNFIVSNAADMKTNESAMFQQVNLMESEYKRAKIDLIEKLSTNQFSSKPEVLNDIKQRLKDIDHANKLLKTELVKDPENSQLVFLLRATHQQELDVLSQLVSLDTTI